jgi:hypothetical protein
MGFVPKPAQFSTSGVVAIYSLHHAAIGKSTQARPHTAAAHIRYITRKSACTRVLSGRMPTQSVRARSWIRRQEDADRSNARVVDKVLLALPRELNPAQRAALVREFAEQVTAGRASWLAAFHDQGNDRDNPHVHLIVRDRDPETGKRVCAMSERGSTERLRELWERHANEALESAGRSERIDRRTLAAQGIRRQPTIHEGLSAREMEIHNRRIRSKTVEYRNGTGARSTSRKVDYSRFDKGRSRPAYNRSIRQSHAEYWAALDTDEIVRSWEAEDAVEAQKTATEPAAPVDRKKAFQAWLARERAKEIPARTPDAPAPARERRVQVEHPGETAGQPDQAADRKKAFQEWLARERAIPPVERKPLPVERDRSLQQERKRRWELD